MTVSLALAFVLRIAEPISTQTIPAEDPFNHMALVRHHLQSGALVPLDDGTNLYPPGLHALLAAVWVYTGMDLAHMIRFGPVLFGIIGVLGMGLLLWRHLGPVGAACGAFAYALAPEIVFRTTMMAPTAMDLALVPFLLYALLELARGRLLWAFVAAAMVAFFVFAHPWLLGILAITVIVFAALAFLVPRAGPEGTMVSLWGLAAVLAMTGVGLGVTMTGCNDYCGPGMGTFLPDALEEAWVPYAVMGVAFVPFLAVLAHRVWDHQANQGHARRSGPQKADSPAGLGPGRRLSSHWRWTLRFVTGGLLLGAVWLLTRPAIEQGFPDFVDLPRMFGWPILIGALAGLVLVPMLPRRIAFLGVGLAVATYPMVVYNVFDSEFWPHRTAAFLGIALAILVGVAAAAITKWATRLYAVLQNRLGQNNTASAFNALLVVPMFLVLIVGSAVVAQTPGPYPGGWYRLYSECEMEGLHELADTVEAEDDLLVITGSWQSRLVLIGHTGKPGKIWFDPTFIRDEDRRNGTLSWQTGPVYLLLDRHMQDVDVQQDDLWFLLNETKTWPHRQVLCQNPDGGEVMVLYSTGHPLE